MPAGQTLPPERRRLSSIRAWLASGLIAMLLTTVAVGWLTYSEMLAVSAGRRLVTRTAETLTALESVASTLKDAETGQRGFLLTGQDNFLDPYYLANHEINTALDSLRQLLAGERLQAQRLDRLSELSLSELSYLSATISLAKESGLASASQRVKTGAGKRSMDRIRALIAEMRQEEARLLKLRTAQLEEESNRTIVLAVVLALGACIFLAAAAVITLKLLKSQESSNDRFRAVFDQTFQFIGLLTPEGTVLEANRTALEFAGIKEADVIGRKFWETPWWSHSANAQEQLKNAVAQASRGQHVRFEAEHPGIDGRTLAVDFSLKPVKDETGKVVLLIPEGHDISERKLLEKRSQCEHQLTRSLAESPSWEEAAPLFLKAICQYGDWQAAVVWTEDDESDCLQAAAIWQAEDFRDDSFASITKTTKHRFGCGWPGRVWAGAEAAWLPSVSEDSVYDRCEAASLSGLKDALFFPVEARGRTLAVIELLSRKTHKPELDFVEIMRAACAQLGQYLEQKATETKSQASQQRYRDLFENASDLIQAVAPDGSFLYVNFAWQKALGFEGEDISHLKLFDIIHPDSRSHCQAILSRVQSGESVHNLQTTFVTREGQPVDVEGNVSASFKDGQLVATRGIFRDITERKAVEKRLSEFYSVVSHELRTPLTSIRASLGLMEGGIAGSLSEKALRLVQIARIESDRLIRLINDILDMKKIEAGKFELYISEVQAGDLIMKAVDGLQSMAHQGQVELVADITCPLSVHADADRIVQVLTNLISNAIKYSPANTDVEINLSAKNSEALFTVSDRGPGIPDNQASKLFNMFQQLDSSDTRKQGGTGLGLAISKAIVEQHGGRIGVESVSGRGSRFWFALPAESARKPSSRPESKSSSRPKVLIVEDDPVAREILKHQLSALDIDCLEAGDGDAALALVASHKPELIILDPGLPKVSGFDVIEILRQNDAGFTPLIVYSANDLSSEEKAKLSLGLTTYLVKSRTSNEEILSTIATMLERSLSITEQG